MAQHFVSTGPEALLDDGSKHNSKYEMDRPSIMRAAYSQHSRIESEVHVETAKGEVHIHAHEEDAGEPETCACVARRCGYLARGCAVVRKVLAWLWHNPDFIKAIIAIGCSMASTIPLGTFVSTPLAANIFQKDSSFINSISTIVGGICALVVAPYFGRWSDRPGNRKKAVLIALLFNGLPKILGLVIFGQTQNAAWVGAFVQPVIGAFGLGGAGMLAVQAMVSEMLPAKHHSVGLTVVMIFAALSGGVVCMLYSLVKSSMHLSEPTAKEGLIWVSLVACLLSPIIMCFVTLQDPVAAPSVERPDQVRRAASCPELGGDAPSVAAAHAASWHGTEEMPSAATNSHGFSLTAPFKTICSSKVLIALFFLHAMLYLGDDGAVDIATNVLYTALGFNDATHDADKAEIAFWFTTLGSGATFPGFIIVLLISAKLGAAGALFWLIPIFALLFASPALVCLGAIKGKWAYLLGGAGVHLPQCLLPQLTTLAAQFAPAGKLGETLGAMTFAAEIASILAPAITAAITGMVQARQQWVIFPLNAAILFCSWAFVVCIYRRTRRTQS